MVKQRIEEINHVMRTAATLDAPSEQLMTLSKALLTTSNNIQKLHGAMLMISTYPDRYPIDEIKAQIVQQFCDR